MPVLACASMKQELPARTPLFGLVLALTVGHTAASMALLIVPAVAPAVAREYGVDASLIGYQISIMAAGVFVALLLVGNLSRKLGGCRTNQLGHALVLTGLVLMLLPSVEFLVPGSLAIGFGFGLLAPSASYLMTRFTPAERRNFVFSVQQTSVPIGGMLAALVGPVIAVSAGWRWSLALNACLVGAMIFMLQTKRREWDNDRDPAAPAITRNPFAAFAANWRDRRLRLLSIAGGAFCWAQFCVASYTVVTCVEALGMSLVLAGTVLTVVQLSSAGGRLIAGWLADWLKSAPRVLEWMAWTMLLCSLASIALTPAWPGTAVYVLFALQGVASGAWAGILLAEFGHLAPKGQVSTVISGALVFVNLGKFIGPIVFAAAYALTRSYGSAFASVAIPAVIALCCLQAVQMRKTS